MFDVREGRRRGLSHLLWLVLIVGSAPGEVRAEEGSDAPRPSPGSVDEHLAGLRSLDPAERIEAIRALGALRSEQTVGPLARVLREDPSPEVRGWAVRSLAEIGTTEARAAMAIAAQHDADQRVRTLAAQMSGSAPTSPFEQPAPMVQTQPQPPTYHSMMEGPLGGAYGVRARRPGLGLIIAGWSVFGGTYLISMIVGGATLADGAEGTWSLFIPVIGPIVEAALLFDSYYEEVVAPLAVVLFIDALAQIAGVAMGTVGLVRRHRARQPQDGGIDPDAEGVDVGEEVSPSSSRSWGVALLPSTGGLTLSGWF